MLSVLESLCCRFEPRLHQQGDPIKLFAKSSFQDHFLWHPLQKEADETNKKFYGAVRKDHKMFPYRKNIKSYTHPKKNLNTFCFLSLYYMHRSHKIKVTIRLHCSSGKSWLLSYWTNNNRLINRFTSNSFVPFWLNGNFLFLSQSNN